MNHPRTLKPMILLVVVAISLLAILPVGSAQDANTGVLRLRVRVKIGDRTRGLARKRFFLVPGTVEQNRALVSMTESRPVLSRECYYNGLGASAALISWLKEGDCESVYCREIEEANLEGSNSVPEFVSALNAGEKEFGSREIARKWIANNIPQNLRDGYYRNRQTELQALIKQAETSPGVKVSSVMTDRNGTAYFTDLVPGNYVISSLLPVEIGSTSVMWNCEVQVKVGDLASEKPYLISNRQDRLVKCVGEEKPLPACVE